ncbi:hypothetical protein SAMN05216376_12035 [Mameliella alba]|nr:hypothetical protein LX94_04778 [Mameliella alba]SDE19115.1 hypothetical protein SAMN05216376_12035 [Mameliella alba]
MAEENCWACLSPLKKHQRVCLNCNSWQGWRGWVGISNTTVALLIALLSVVALIGEKLLALHDEYYPNLEVHISGYFDSESRVITLNIYNFGEKPANFGSNLRCTFGLKDAMGHSKNNEGVEVEFWSTSARIVSPESALQIEFTPQVLAFDPMHEQVLCFGALNYFDRTTLVEPFFLTIVPNSEHIWWPIEGFSTTNELIEALYPKKVTFQ